MSDLISRISLIEDARETRKDVLWDRYTEADDKPFDDLIKLCKRAERYRWHDLRKNPEDLPEKYKSVLVAFNAQCGIGYAVSERLDDAQSWSALCGMAPFAWREIEPFEEVESDD